MATDGSHFVQTRMCQPVNNKINGAVWHERRQKDMIFSTMYITIEVILREEWVINDPVAYV